MSLLKKESELPFDELLSSLPEDLIENIGKPLEETVSEVASVPVKVCLLHLTRELLSLYHLELICFLVVIMRRILP